MNTKNGDSTTIIFKARLFTTGSFTILILPASASALLPSRAMNMVEGTINGYPLLAPLEPDGKGSHWLRITDELLHTANLKAGETVKLVISPSPHWPEPVLPSDLKAVLDDNPHTMQMWQQVTTKAHWEWLRWINSTGNAETRQRRIAIAAEKLNKGMKRPCCFNSNICTVPEVSRNGVLLSQEE